MDDLSAIVKLSALLILGVGALLIAYKAVVAAVKIASWIYRVTTQPPPPPQADARPVSERDERTGEPGEVELQLFDGKRYRKAAGQ